MRDGIWIIYLFGTSLGTVVWFLTGKWNVIFSALGMVAPVMMALALRLWRPVQPRPWRLFTIGMIVFIGGDVLSYNYQTLFHPVFPALFPLDAAGRVPFPTWPDACYLAVYGFLIAGVASLIRARSPGRDLPSLVDALLFSIGIGTVSWVLLISPRAFAENIPLTGKLTAMAYPMLNLLLLATLIRLSVAAGRKPVAFQLMAAAILTLLLTDSIYGWLNLYAPGGYPPGSGLLEAGWMAFYALFAAAALHPSMRQMSEQVLETTQQLSRGRLVALTATALLVPGLLAVEAFQGTMRDLPVLIGATCLLFILAMVRMWDLARRQQELLHTEQTLRADTQRRTAELTAANEELRMVAHSISHDLKAPLRAVEGFSQMLREDCNPALDAHGREYLDKISAGATRMSRMIDDLLLHTRLGEWMTLGPVDLGAVWARVQADLAGDIRAAAAEVTVDGPLPGVWGDAATLEALLRNLLSNAVKFVAPGVTPRVVLGVQPEAGGYRLSVRDNGIGMAPEHRERIFGLFERLHAHDEYPGTGVGLALVRKAAQLHGTTIRVESTPGQGSTFHFYLRGAGQQPGSAAGRTPPAAVPAAGR
jgi:signal transduction histidine kinase